MDGYTQLCEMRKQIQACSNLLCIRLVLDIIVFSPITFQIDYASFLCDNICPEYVCQFKGKGHKTKEMGKMIFVVNFNVNRKQ